MAKGPRHDPSLVEDMSQGEYLRQRGWRKSKKDGLWRHDDHGGGFLPENALAKERGESGEDPDSVMRTHSVQLTLNGPGLRSVLECLDSGAKGLIEPGMSNAEGNRDAAAMLNTSAAIEEAFEGG